MDGPEKGAERDTGCNVSRSDVEQGLPGVRCFRNPYPVHLLVFSFVCMSMLLHKNSTSLKEV